MHNQRKDLLIFTEDIIFIYQEKYTRNIFTNFCQILTYITIFEKKIVSLILNFKRILQVSCKF